MESKKTIWLVDTTILLNILDVPGRNQDKPTVFKEFEERIQAGDLFFLPYAAIVECGNHISRLSNANQRKKYAVDFVDLVRETLIGSLPWKPSKMPLKDDLHVWLNRFPISAESNKSFADHSMIEEWLIHSKDFPHYHVTIWSLDSHLNGYST